MKLVFIFGLAGRHARSRTILPILQKTHTRKREREGERETRTHQICAFGRKTICLHSTHRFGVLCSPCASLGVYHRPHHHQIQLVCRNKSIQTITRAIYLLNSRPVQPPSITVPGWTQRLTSGLLLNECDVLETSIKCIHIHTRTHHSSISLPLS